MQDRPVTVCSTAFPRGDERWRDGQMVISHSVQPMSIDVAVCTYANRRSEGVSQTCHSGAVKHVCARFLTDLIQTRCEGQHYHQHRPDTWRRTNAQTHRTSYYF